MITRFSAGLVQAYDFSTGAAVTSDVVPTVAFPITDAANLKPDSCAVAPDLSRAVYATPNRVNCIDRDGSTLWQLDFPARVIGAAERLQPLRLLARRQSRVGLPPGRDGAQRRGR
jgi:hypothetical protein